MSSEKKKRKAVRSQRDQLLTLVNGWDPAGRLEAGAPRDAYVGVVDRLLPLLSHQATKDDVTEFLDREISEHFGTKPQGSGEFANKLVAWFSLEHS
jgi:hypothetical protein